MKKKKARGFLIGWLSFMLIVICSSGYYGWKQYTKPKESRFWGWFYEGRLISTSMNLDYETIKKYEAKKIEPRFIKDDVEY